MTSPLTSSPRSSSARMLARAIWWYSSTVNRRFVTGAAPYSRLAVYGQIWL